jgi:uncharacterized C2H2 Zn-finger protein
MSTTQPKEAVMPQSQTQLIGVPMGHHIPGTNALTGCPECKAVLPTPQSYALHYEQDHLQLTPLAKVLDGFMKASNLAWELADAMEKVDTTQHQVLKAQGETLAECARALRKAMEESGLG